jgi:uncharacterized membrane protein YhdT
MEQRYRSKWNLVLLVPLLITLYPPLYNRADPGLFGIPFFYWFQLAAVVVGIACTAIVYRATSRRGCESRPLS